jgi:acetate kinase
VACFDTAFHADLPDAAATYALPSAWRSRWGLRRFGFHGLSHAYAARRVAELAGQDLAELRVVTCHLGAGASLCAVRGGRSVDTTMGFTPLEGLVMGTRAGSVDPGLLMYVLEKLPREEVSAALEEKSGLLGLSESSGDMREVRRAADSGDIAARLALDVYGHRLRAELAAMAMSMDGLDVVAFTGGVGEADPRTRSMAESALLGIHLDESANASAEGDAEIGRSDAPVRAFVVEAREDVEIACQVRRALG